MKYLNPSTLYRVDRLTVFDRDGDGYITVVELRDVMMSMGERLTEEEVANMLTEADRNGDGKIDYDGTCV